MNDRQDQANDVQLKRILRDARPEPRLPPRFAESVWHRIERAEVESRSSEGWPWLLPWLSWMLRPKWALTGAMAIMLLGALVGLMHGAGDAHQAARDRYVASVAPQVLH